MTDSILLESELKTSKKFKISKSSEKFKNIKLALEKGKEGKI